jgi:hypothetical protein
MDTYEIELEHLIHAAAENEEHRQTQARSL